MTPPIVFKKPPLVEVALGLQFQNNLEVADARHRYHALIQGDFPVVIIPEQTSMKHDFGDYALFSEGLSTRIEIGMSYFKMVTRNYPGFPAFRHLFFNAFGIFAKTYPSIGTYSTLAYEYINNLPVGAKQDAMRDILQIEVNVPEPFIQKYVGGQGLLLFQETQGVAVVDLKPEFTDNKISSYGFTLRFVVNRNFAQDEIQSLVDVAHDHLDNYFFSLLRPQYVDFLASRQ